MTSLRDTERACLSLGMRGAFEGVARRPWMAGGMGTDDALTTTTHPARHQPQRVVEKCDRSVANSETPQLLLANDLLFLFYQAYDGNSARGLHTHEQLTFHAPVPLDERVTVTGGYVEKYARRGHGYVVMEAEARGEDGRLLVSHRGIEIMRVRAGGVVGRRTAQPQGRRFVGEADAGQTPVESARRGMALRAPIAPLRKHVTQEQMMIFSWGGRFFTNVHTSLERARESGLDRTLIQAQHQITFITELMVRFFGTSWFTTGTLDLRVLSPAYEGDRFTVGGVVLGERPSKMGALLDLEVWVERDEGPKTVIGWASAAV